jgi:hypothetical protein
MKRLGLFSNKPSQFTELRSFPGLHGKFHLLIQRKGTNKQAPVEFNPPDGKTRSSERNSRFSLGSANFSKEGIQKIFLKRIQLFTTFLRSVRRLIVTANVVPSSPFLVTLMREALSPSEMSVLTRATLRNILGDCILHSHRRVNLTSYITLTGWAL